MKLLLLSIFICCAQAIDIMKDEIEAAVGCDVIECQNGGKCFGDERSGHWCMCPPGFVGVYCEKEETYSTAKRSTDVNDEIETRIGCDIKECQNGGECLSDERGDYLCMCPSGFSGYYCEKEDSTVAKQRCRCTNGYCGNEDGVAKCMCHPEYALYEEDYCKACPCGKGINCTFEVKGSFVRTTCFCPDGWDFDGEKCVLRPSDSTFTEPFTPTEMFTFIPTRDPCREEPCLNGGLCTLNGNSYECFCRSGFAGKHCERYITTPNYWYSTKYPLSTGAPYSTTADRYSTRYPFSTRLPYSTTRNGYSTRYPFSTRRPYTSSEYRLSSTNWRFSSPRYGSTIDFETTLDCPCENGLCVIDTYGNIKCLCKPQHAKNSGGVCTPCNCGQNAECEIVGEGRNSQKRCLCPAGYEERYEYCVDIDECVNAESCPTNTECVNTEGSYDCICKEGYRPYNRTSQVKYQGCIEMCNANTCLNGECRINGYSSFCKCDSGYTGLHCEQKVDKFNDNRIIDIIEIQSPWIILSGLLLIIFLAFIIIHRNKSVKKNTFIFSSPDEKCPLFEDPKFVNRLQTEILE